MKRPETKHWQIGQGSPKMQDMVFRHGLVLVSLLLLDVVFFATACQTRESATSPNIVILLADDMGIGDIGAYNPDSRIPTPKLDRLAAEGIRLTDAHSPSSVCTPTRYGLLTGRYAWRTALKQGVLVGDSTMLIEPGRETIASLLRQKGYATAVIGKWHLGLGEGEKTDYSRPLTPGPNDFGFDDFFGIPASLDMAPYLYVENDHPVEAPTGWTAASAHRREGGNGFWREGPISPGFRHDEVLTTLTDRALNHLDHWAALPDQPFFLYLALTAPHTPWLPAEEYRGRSDAGFYGDFVVQVDAELGRVLDAIDRRVGRENTLVFFTSDNGAHWPEEDIARFHHRANSYFRGQKADIWEGGHRVPFLARWPGRIPAASTSDDLFSLTDLFATIAAIVEIEPDSGYGEDSLNQLAVLTGSGVSAPRTTMVQHSYHGMFAMRSGDWKLIPALGSGGFTEPVSVDLEPGGAEGQLYNLREDPGEERNLYREYPDRVRELENLLKMRQQTGSPDMKDRQKAPRTL